MAAGHQCCAWSQLIHSDTAAGETLICACTCSFEIVVRKLTIVAMVMQTLHAMLLGKVLKSLLGVDCLL